MRFVIRTVSKTNKWPAKLSKLKTKLINILSLLTSLILILLIGAVAPNEDKNVGGYVGPACAVVDDQLFMHGFYIRRLTVNELHEFHQYQSTLNVWHQLSMALARGAASVAPGDSQLLTPPRVPAFCNGLDDSVEVVLNTCTIRNYNVYVADRFVRELSPTERLKIDALIKPAKNRDSTRLLKKRRRDIATTLNHLERIDAVLAQRPLLDEETSRPPIFVLGDRRLRPIQRSRRPAPVTQLRADNDTTPSLTETSGSNSTEKPQHRNGQQLQEQLDGKRLTKQRRSSLADHAATNGEGYVVPSGFVNFNDALLLNLLQSLATQQQTVDKIVDAQHNQQLQQRQQLIKELQQQTDNNALIEKPVFTTAKSMTSLMRVGDKILIGGQTYVAIPLASFPMPSTIFGNKARMPHGGAPTLGLMPIEALRVFMANKNTHAGPSQQFPSIDNPAESTGQVQYGSGNGLLPLGDIRHENEWNGAGQQQHHRHQFHRYVTTDQVLEPKSVPTHSLVVDDQHLSYQRLPHEICQNVNSVE